MKKKFLLYFVVLTFATPLFAQDSTFLNLYKTELITSDLLSFHLNGTVYPRSIFSQVRFNRG